MGYKRATNQLQGKAMNKVTKAEFLRFAASEGLIFMGVFRAPLAELAEKVAKLGDPEGIRNPCQVKGQHLKRIISEDRTSNLRLDSDDQVFRVGKYWLVNTVIEKDNFTNTLIYG